MFAWQKGDLNDEQEKAVLQDGHVFLVACPGSGKTRTLTYKAAYELSRLKSSKQFVVAITYTHRAADEIKERIEALGVDTEQLWIGTIHSFCLEWILKPYHIYHPVLKSGFTILGAHESEEILTRLCGPYRNPRVSYFDCGYYFEPGGHVLSCPDVTKHPHLREVLDQYFAELTAAKQIDFELMLYCAYQLIISEPRISQLLSQLFTHILVDEYQDTKKVQYEIASAILRAGVGRTLAFVVGDPNQAIFTSLGGYAISAKDFAASAGIQLNELELSENYRNSKRIVNYFGHYNVHATKIVAASSAAGYPSLITLNVTVDVGDLDAELERLVRYNIEQLGVPQSEVCVLAPWWAHLGGMTRRLVARMPTYRFDGPGMVPFSRDQDNFWFKLSRIVLTQASPAMYVRRLRWAQEIVADLVAAGVSTANVGAKSLLRASNAIVCAETDGLLYLREVFDLLLGSLGIDFSQYATLAEQHKAFFESSQRRIDRMVQEGTPFISDIETFRKVFQLRSGVTISTIHGIKGDEYDTVIAYGLLEGMVPHFSDQNGTDSAMKLLYVIASRARKNLHLISERGRRRGGGRGDYDTTDVLAAYPFGYDVV